MSLAIIHDLSGRYRPSGKILVAERLHHLNGTVEVQMQIEANDNEPYLRGCQAFEAGIQRHENPYEDDHYGTTFWEAWFDGWDDANENCAHLSQIESPR